MELQTTVPQTPDPNATAARDDQPAAQPLSGPSIPQVNLRDQIAAASAYVRSSFRMSNPSQSQSRLSMGLRSSLGSASHSDATALRSSLVRSSGELEASSDDEPADEKFILDFAKQCATYPGRKPLLVDIEGSLATAQQPQLPMILVPARRVAHA